MWGDEGKALEARIAAVVAGGGTKTWYTRVVMVGHSMGGTAALLCARLATQVIAFCPQVCVSTCPQLTREEQMLGEDDTLELLRMRLCRNVRDAHFSGCTVNVHIGTLAEDERQCAMLPPSSLPDCRKHRHPLASHDLPALLRASGELAPLLASAMTKEEEE